MELLIAMVIIAVLAVIAYPKYVDYVRQSARKAAIGKMLEIATRVEQFRTQRLAYPSLDADLDSFARDEVKYQYRVAATTTGNGVTGYTVTATPLLDQLQDECGTLVYFNDSHWEFADNLTEQNCL